MDNIIVTITGPSCSGKTTFANELLKDSKYKYIPTYTTRPPRDDDSDRDYIFMTEEGFEEAKEEGIFLETNYFDGEMYGTSIDSVKDIFEEKAIGVKVLDPNGVQNLESVADKLDFTVVKVWIGGRPEILKERLTKRNQVRDTQFEESWYKRIKWNFVIKELYDYNRELHVEKLKVLLPTLARQDNMRVWAS